MQKKIAGLADSRLQEVLNRLGSSTVRCIDTETSGLDWRKHHIVGYVITFSPDPRDSYYIPFRHAGGGNVGDRAGPQDREGWDGELAPGEQELLDALDQQGTILFGHHLNFDLRFLWRAGMRQFRPRFEDTMINAPLLDEWQRSYSLEFCANDAKVFAKKSSEIAAHIYSLYPDLCVIDGKGDKAPMAHYWRLSGNDPVAVDYATGDGTSTWQLRDWQMQQIAKQELTRVHDVECRLIPVLARMSAFGIKINVERLEQLIEDTGKRVEQLLNTFPSGFNVRSPGDVQRWCESHGNNDWPHTPGRVRIVTEDDVEYQLASPDDIGKKMRVPAPSFPEAWLSTHEAGRKIVEIRKLETLRSSFLKPMHETHLWNGRVHSTYNQLRNDEYGTITGRLSASDPNLTAVSKHDKMIGRLHRSIFTPDVGKRWANADYAQIEPCLLAIYANCKVLIDGYNADPPIDAHTSASAAANRNWPNMSPAERKKYRDDIGKRINQTIITGGGRGVLVSKYGVPEDMVDQVLRDYFTAMPEIRDLQKNASARMKKRGWVMSLLGRRARLLDRNKAYMAVNRLLQCGNADIIKLKMVQIDEYLASEGRPMEMLNSIHDDLAFQFDEGARKHYEECLRIMTDFGPGQPIEISKIPIRIDSGEGNDWAEATYGPSIDSANHGVGRPVKRGKE